MPTTATYNGALVASSDNTVYLEGNHYFPRESVVQGFLIPSTTPYTCPWKGPATYYSGEINGAKLQDVAWSYENPKPAAENIKNFVAFDKRQIVVNA